MGGGIEITDPARHGLDRERLAAIDAFLQERYVAPGKLPHAQLLIGRGDAIVHFSSIGPAREGADTPVDETTLFRIASMTKPVTSIAFMQLVEEGRVGLDTPVDEVLPELGEPGVYEAGGGDAPFATRPPAQPMRMIDLLRHTSGFTYGFQQRSAVDAAYRAGDIERWYGHLTLDQFVKELAKLPLEFSPGEAWNYSVSTDVLGAIVERIAGQPLSEVFAGRIFGPLGMTDTFFDVPADKIDRLADCWAFDPGVGRLSYDRGAESLWAKAPTLVSGGGGLVSSARDYHRFCRMLLDGGSLDGARVVGRKTIELMTRNHLPGGADLATLSKSLFSEANYAGIGFGLGFAVTVDPARALLPGSVGEFFWGGIFSTYFFVDPVERLIAVFMTQLTPSSLYPIRRELKTMIYAALT